MHSARACWAQPCRCDDLTQTWVSQEVRPQLIWWCVLMLRQWLVLLLWVWRQFYGQGSQQLMQRSHKLHCSFILKKPPPPLLLRPASARGSAVLAPHPKNLPKMMRHRTSPEAAAAADRIHVRPGLTTWRVPLGVEMFSRDSTFWTRRRCWHKMNVVKILW